MAESFGIGGAFADCNIGEEAEYGTSPVGPAPGVGVVESFVAGFGQAQRTPFPLQAMYPVMTVAYWDLDGSEQLNKNRRNMNKTEE